MKAGDNIGPYRIVKRLGEGGIGEVYQAVDESLARDVAIKRLRPELAERNTLVTRFRTEAQTLARLNHPNIATLYALVDEGPATYMVMEYVDGETVASLLRQRGALDLEPALRLAFQALAGIGYAHDRGVIHRDIKGSNLMLDSNGTLKVMDFGIARVLGDERHTRAGQLIGTPEFMAPEQIRGEDADERSDLYSLAILLFSLFTGRAAFQARSEYDLMKAQVEEEAPSLLEHCSELPRGLDAALRRALAKDPARRFQNASEFRRALQPFASDSWTDGPLIWPARSPAGADRARVGDADVDAPTRASVMATSEVTGSDSLPLIEAELIEGEWIEGDSRAATPLPCEALTADLPDAELASSGSAAEDPTELASWPRSAGRWFTGPRLAAAGLAVGAVLGLDLISASPVPPVSASGAQLPISRVQLEASRPPNSTLGDLASPRELRENLFTANQSLGLDALDAAPAAGPEPQPADGDAESDPARGTAAATASAEPEDRAKAAGRVGRSTKGTVKPRSRASAGKRGEPGWVIRR